MTQVKIKRLAELSGLVIPEARYEKMEKDLSEIIHYFSILDPIDVSHVEHVTSAGSPDLSLREDVVHDDFTTREALLASSPQRVTANQIMLDSIMQTDEK